MKNLITAIACMLVLSVFLIQFTTNQVVHNKILFVENDINAFIEEIKHDGYVSQENKDELTIKIREDLKDPTALVEFDSNSNYTDSANPVYRGGLFSYSVTYEIKNVVGAAKLLNMENNNTAVRTRSGQVASEYVSW